MNHALWNGESGEWYLASTRKDESGVFMSRGKRISKDGRLLQTCAGFVFKTIFEADRKCRDLVKTKLKHGYVSVSEVPACVLRHFEVPPDTRVTAEELAGMLRATRKERYVVFSDVHGIEDGFDEGVEYLGEFEDGAEYVKAYDRFGAARECLLERLSSMELTERALEAKEAAGRFGMQVPGF